VVIWLLSLLASASPLQIHDAVDSPVLSPLHAPGAAGLDLVFDRLYARDPTTGEVVPRLVGSDAISEGGRAVTITLRDGPRWHDGVPVTARDVCFTVRARLQSPSRVARASGFNLEDCEVIDERTARIRLARSHADPRALLLLHVLPAHAYADDPIIPPDHPQGFAPLGSGPMSAVRDGRAWVFSAAPGAWREAPVSEVRIEGPVDPFVAARLAMVDPLDDPSGPLAPAAVRLDAAGAGLCASGLKVGQSVDRPGAWVAALYVHPDGALASARGRAGVRRLLDRAQVCATADPLVGCVPRTWLLSPDALGSSPTRAPKTSKLGPNDGRPLRLLVVPAVEPLTSALTSQVASIFAEIARVEVRRQAPIDPAALGVADLVLVVGASLDGHPDPAPWLDPAAGFAPFGPPVDGIDAMVEAWAGAPDERARAQALGVLERAVVGEGWIVPVGAAPHRACVDPALVSRAPMAYFGPLSAFEMWSVE